MKFYKKGYALLLNFVRLKGSTTNHYLDNELMKTHSRHIYKHSGRQLGYLQCIKTINCHCRDLTHFMSHLYPSTIFPLCYRPEATCFKQSYLFYSERKDWARHSMRQCPLLKLLECNMI